MSLYQGQKGELKGLQEKPFANEREMQRLVETNLGELFGLRFIESEFAPNGNLRIDTLAFDESQKSFVIIEYKKGSSWSVVDQGYAYLALLLDRKADFVLRLNKHLDTKFTLEDIDWESSRVVFIAPSFTVYQRGALGFRDISFELYKLERYVGDILSLEQVQGKETTARLSDIKQSSEEARRVQREVKSYSVDDHFKEDWESSRELYEELASRLVELDPRLGIRPVKSYIGITIGRKNVFSVHARKASLIFHIVRFKPQELRDPENKLALVGNSFKYYNVHISTMNIANKEDIDYAVMIARQALKKY